MLSDTQAAPAESEDAELRCRVAVEELSPGGQPRKRQALRTAELSLGRNERRELVLRLQAPGSAGRPRCFPLRAARLFTRFAATGRSTLRLPADGEPRAGAVQLLLSDCPADRLRRFLRTLRLKLAVAPGPGPASARTQLLAPRPRDFVTISPVQPEELRRAAAIRAPDTSPVKRPMEFRAGAEPSTRRTGIAGVGGTPWGVAVLLRWTRPRRPKFGGRWWRYLRGLRVKPEEMPIGHPEDDRDVGVVRVFLIAQSLRLSK